MTYFVTTAQGEFVLTLVEQWAATEVPYFIELTAWLAARGFPCARPVADRRGERLKMLRGRPAALVERLAGRSVETPAIAHCRAVGRILAELHQCSAGFPAVRKDMRGQRWRLHTARKVQPVMPTEAARLLADELAFQSRQWFPGAPRGVIHADLFRDNVLFEAFEVTGVIDFYYACNDLLVYDLAVTVNDWCTRPDGSLEEESTLAVLTAYAGRRSLLEAEAPAWPVMLRAAALRFWLSRLKDQLFPREAHTLQVKDPEPLARILRHRRRHEDALAGLWREAAALTAAA
jgi:homoserine kinase type II